jgi:type III secretion system low calcium response chaperone LcrH/SycD
MSTDPKANPNKYDAMDVTQMQDALQRLNINAGEQAQAELKKILSAALDKGVMPKTALKLDDTVMEAIYSQAYTLYNHGKYKEASYIFRLLMLLDFTTPKYVLGLAACSHRMKEYTNASNLYMIAAGLDPTNPLPHFHATDCYIQLGAPALAIISLGMAITAAGAQAQYKLIKERAELMKSTLEQQIDNQASPKKEEKAANEQT